MDILTILGNKIKPGDKMTTERKKQLARDLENLSLIAAESAFDVIRQYRDKDPVKKIGATISPIPYYGVENSEGMTFSIHEFPEKLQLILEQVVISSKDD